VYTAQISGVSHTIAVMNRKVWSPLLRHLALVWALSIASFDPFVALMSGEAVMLRSDLL
jgi:hypothetical protein